MRTLIARTLSVVVVAVASLFACATGGFAADSGSSESGTGVGTVSDFTANHEVINAVAAGIVDHGGLYGYEGATIDKADDVVAALKGTKVAVAVIPRGEYSRTEVRSIFESVRGLISPEYTTVIGFAQSEGEYVSVASSEDERGAKDIEGIWEDLLGSRGRTATPGQDVLDNVDTIKDAVAGDGILDVSNYNFAFSLRDFGIGLLACVLAVIYAFFCEQRSDKAEAAESMTNRGHEEYTSLDPDSPKEDFEKAKRWLKMSIPDTVRKDKIAYPMIGLYESSSRLFEIARDLKVPESTLNSMYVEFTDKFNKVSKLVRNYYVPMMENPHQWKKVEDKKREIRIAVESVEREVREALQRLTDDSYAEAEAIFESLIKHDL